MISFKKSVFTFLLLVSFLYTFLILISSRTYELYRRSETKAPEIKTIEDLSEMPNSAQHFIYMDIETKAPTRGRIEETTDILRGPYFEQESERVPSKLIQRQESHGSDFREFTSDKQVKVISHAENVQKSYEELLGCRKLPDILIIGFEKCGTVTLKTFLGIHPEIFHSSEGNYKLFNNGQTVSTESVKEYNKDEKCTPTGMLRLDKLANWGTAENAYKVIPNAKLLAIVREPVERAMSHYIHRLEKGIENERYNFDDTILSIMAFDRHSVLFSQSTFIQRLDPWIELYGLEKIHIVDGDNFVRNPVQELEKVEKFIGIKHFITGDHFAYSPEKRFYCLKEGEDTTCMTAMKGRPHQQMSNQTRTILQQYFKPFNERLFETFQRNLSWNY